MIKPDLSEWENLYKAAIRFRNLACWDWMTDADLYGIRNPFNNDVGYCCVLGYLGEVFGLVVYFGTEGLNCYLEIQKMAGVSPDDLLLSQNCIVVSYENRNHLSKEDLKTIRDLGLKFKGNNVYPIFRRYEPGYYPREITRDEAIYLILVLEQSIDIVKLFRDEESIMNPPGDGYYFVRSPYIEGGALKWTDAWEMPAPLKKPPVEIFPIDELRIQRLLEQALKKEGIIELDFFSAFMPVREGNRAFFPVVLLIVDHLSGFVYSTHVCRPASHRAEMQDFLFSFMEQYKVIPQEILVKEEEILNLIAPLASKLKIKLTPTKKLRETERAKRSFRNFIKGRKI
ncbi:MAG: hypothetical protein AB1478_05290 [Nitrospirota bacterium]